MKFLKFTVKTKLAFLLAVTITSSNLMAQQATKADPSKLGLMLMKTIGNDPSYKLDRKSSKKQNDEMQKHDPGAFLSLYQSTSGKEALMITVKHSDDKNKALLQILQLRTDTAIKNPADIETFKNSKTGKKLGNGFRLGPMNGILAIACEINSKMSAQEADRRIKVFISLLRERQEVKQSNPGNMALILTRILKEQPMYSYNKKVSQKETSKLREDDPTAFCSQWESKNKKEIVIAIVQHPADNNKAHATFIHTRLDLPIKKKEDLVIFRESVGKKLGTGFEIRSIGGHIGIACVIDHTLTAKQADIRFSTFLSLLKQYRK